MISVVKVLIMSNSLVAQYMVSNDKFMRVVAPVGYASTQGDIAGIVEWDKG